MESPRDIQNQITSKLTEDGLNPVSSDLEKLLFLWKRYLQLQEDLKKSQQNETKIKEAQAEEMKEVESYVEHIRQLSDEREALIQELESENESLKLQMVHLQQENSVSAKAEIIEMLTEQGLAEIAKSSPGEQIAYLIVERTKLLEEAEKLKRNSSSSAGQSSNIEQILEQERADFEQELNQQRESAKILREQLKQEHEEEISALIEENGKLEEDLQDAEMRLSQLKAELSKYTEEDHFDSSVNRRSLRMGNSVEMKQLDEERNQLNREREEIEKEMAEIESDRADFQKERDAFCKEKLEFEKQKNTILTEVMGLKEIKEDIETENCELKSKIHELQREKKLLEAKLEEKVNREPDIGQETLMSEKGSEEYDEKDSSKVKGLRSGSPARSSSDIMLRKVIEDKTKIEGELVQLKTQMRSMQKEKESHDEVVNNLKKDLDKSALKYKQLEIKNTTLNKEVESLETQLDELDVALETLKKEKETLSSKNESLTSEIKTLRADASKSSTLQDIVEILSNDKKHLNETLETMKMKFEQTANEKDELVNQNQKLSKEEHDLTNQLQNLKQELDRLTKEKEYLSSHEHKLLAVTKKQEEVEKLLKADLEELSKTKENLVHQTEILTKENKELLNKLDKTKVDAEAVRLYIQEIDKLKLIIAHLKEQNQQLLQQLKSLQAELEKSKERETMLITNQHMLQKRHGDTEKRLSHDVEDMKAKLELTLQELAKSKKHCDELDMENREIKTAFGKAQKLLDESIEIKNILEEEKQQKNQFKKDLQHLQLQLLDKTKIAENLENEKKMRLFLEKNIEVYKNVEQKLNDVTLELTTEKNTRQKLERKIEELKKFIATQVSKEKLVAAEEELYKEKQLSTQYEVRLKELEHEVKHIEISKKSAEELLENELKMRQSLEKHVKDLQMSSTQQDTLEEMVRLREELYKEREVVKDLQESEQDIQLLCAELDKERNLTAEMSKKLSELELANKESATSTLKAALDELERERQSRVNSDLKLQELEQLLDDQKIDNDNMRHSLNGKIFSQEKRIQALEEDLFTAQDEYQALQDKYSLVVKELEINKSEAMEMDIVDSSQAACKEPSSFKDKDLEKSLYLMTLDLNEALNEVNIVKTKLYQTQEELEKFKLDNEKVNQDLTLLKQSLEMSNKHLEKSETELSALKKDMAETQGSLQFTQNQLQTKQTKLDSLVKDKEELQKELASVKDSQQENINSLPFFEKERKNLVDKISVLEKLSQQLELDNRELSQKLVETSTKVMSYEAELDREKEISSNKNHQDRRYTEQLEHDLDTSNKHIRQLREEIQQHQAKVFKLESDNLGLAAKYESMIVHLEQNIHDLKQKHKQEMSIVQEQLDSVNQEARELKPQNKRLEEEITKMSCDLSRFKTNAEKLELHLQAEIKIKLELEKRNAVIDMELSKTYSQIRSLLDKNVELESVKHSYELDMTMQKSNIQRAESSILQKEATYEASTKAIVARAEAAEKRARESQKELEELTQKMLHIEEMLSQAEKGKGFLNDTKDQIVAIRNQLEGEKLQRTFLDQTVTDLKNQVAFLKQREVKLNLENRELHQTIIDLESNLNRLQINFTRDSDALTTENNQHSMMDQIARLQREVKELQFELTHVSEKRDVDIKRYEERKLRTKSKLIKAREFYTNERSKYIGQMQQVDNDLRLTRSMLEKELEWRDKMDESYKQLLREKRELITQLSEAEESLKDKSRALSMAQTRMEFLEEENANFQDLLEEVTLKKQKLDRFLKDKTLSLSENETDPSVGMCGFGTDRDSEWDSYDHVDQQWTTTIEPPANFRKPDNNTETPSTLNQTKIKSSKSFSSSGNLEFLPPMALKFKRYSQTDDFKLSQDDFYDEEDEFEA